MPKPTPICSVDGCEKPVRGIGYCGMHMQRHYRNGHPLRLRRPTPLEAFWQRVEKTESCWNWTGNLRNGYGRLSTGKTPTKSGTNLAHRVSYELHVGEIPEDLHIDHLCRNTACVNPDHLEPVTVKENVRRGLHGVLRTHCQHGHELTPDNVYYDEKTNCRRCKTCNRKHTHEATMRNRVGNELYNRSRRKPCQGCGGEKGPGMRKKFCDACQERRNARK